MSKVLGDLLMHFRTYGQAFGHGSGRRVCSAEITSTALSCKASWVPFFRQPWDSCSSINDLPVLNMNSITQKLLRSNLWLKRHCSIFQVN